MTFPCFYIEDVKLTSLRRKAWRNHDDKSNTADVRFGDDVRFNPRARYIDAPRPAQHAQRASALALRNSTHRRVALHRVLPIIVQDKTDFLIGPACLAEHADKIRCAELEPRSNRTHDDNVVLLHVQ